MLVMVKELFQLLSLRAFLLAPIVSAPSLRPATISLSSCQLLNVVLRTTVSGSRFLLTLVPEVTTTTLLVVTTTTSKVKVKVSRLNKASKVNRLSRVNRASKLNKDSKASKLNKDSKVNRLNRLRDADVDVDDSADPSSPLATSLPRQQWLSLWV